MEADFSETMEQSDHDLLVRLSVLSERLIRDVDSLRRESSEVNARRDEALRIIEQRLVSLERVALGRDDVEKLVKAAELAKVQAAVVKLESDMIGIQTRIARWMGGITVAGLVLHFVGEYVIRTVSPLHL